MNQLIKHLSPDYFLLIICLMLSQMLFSCNSREKELVYSHADIANIIDQVNEVMIHDVVNPPLASRYFSYITLAGMEAIRPVYPGAKDILTKINGYNFHEYKEDGIDYHLAATLSMLMTAREMQPSGILLQPYIDDVVQKCLASGISNKVIKQTEAYSQSVSSHVVSHSKTDGFRLISSLPKYEPNPKEGSWFPTPPGYFPAVEPYFNTLRPFFLDSAKQFVPKPPVSFSKEAGSPFFLMVQEVYRQVLTDEQKSIAAFWDCNPFALEDNGHLMIGLKKISPGAHWMGIANIACKDSNLSFEKTLEINSVLAMSIHDAFMTCWDEKYRSERIRPESVIRKLIDPAYRPFLQTPPFPEYLSGHSVVSTTSSVVLSHYFGDNFAYMDTVEVKFGLEKRGFTSFKAAAEEAAISRLYGGIHYMDAIVEGQVQGNQVGNFIVEKLRKE